MKAYALQFVEETDAESFRGGEPADYCSEEGASSLKTIIEAYWAARGQQVTVALHNVGFHPAIRAARFDVRSDMINGKPRCANASTTPSLAIVGNNFESDWGDLDDN